MSDDNGSGDDEVESPDTEIDLSELGAFAGGVAPIEINEEMEAAPAELPEDLRQAIDRCDA